ncbi:MAG: SDR family NAD(P)-dependent oxidoreductase [Polyangiaceae bacterium]
MRFIGKTVIVTGASSPQGIGAAVARQFAAEGAKVVLAARSREGLEAVAEQVRAERVGAEVLVVPTDLTDVDACERLVSQTLDRFERLDVLVNNAGFNRRGPVMDQQPRDLAQIIAVNLTAPIVLTRMALSALRVRRGVVVQVASIAGQFPLDDEATYSASKFGLRAFSFALREELRDSGVGVSVVSPGPVDTAFIREELDEVPDVVFANPMSTADEVAALVLDGAEDRRRERTIPVQTGMLARFAAAFPAVRRIVKPVMEKKGRAAKARFREQGG